MTAVDQVASATSRRAAVWVLPVLALAVLASLVAGLAVGAYPISPGEILAAVGRVLSRETGAGLGDAVLWDIRLPRVVLAALVGGCLASAGAIMQGIFANPLAEPGLVGVSSGAAVGAVVAIVLGVTTLGVLALPAAAFAGGVGVTALVYLASRVGGRTEVLTLILTGIAVNAFAGAVIGMLMTVSDDAQLRSITFWNLGSVANATWPAVVTVLPFAAVGLITAQWLARPLDLLALGERSAQHLGVNVERVRRVAILITAAMTAAAVAVAGIIGFVGLVVPHAVRLVIGPGHRLLLPASALAGAALVIWADLFARTVAAPREIPLGVVTGLIGSPVFFWLLRREHRTRGAWA